MSVIDDYLKKVDAPKREELKRLRDLSKQYVPDGEDAIVYAMPTMKYKGKALIGFDAHKNHIGIYPYSGQAIKDLKDILGGFEVSKGAIRVPLDKPISENIFKQIIAYRLEKINSQK